MIFRSLAVPVVATNLEDFLDDSQIRGRGVALQAPITNAENLLFGDSAMQPGFVPPGGATSILPITTLSDLYILGTAGDFVIVMVF